jgi:TatD DNase family protein
VIDSHCHLADKAFDADRDTVIERARTAGISPMVTIADSLDEAELCIEIAKANADIFATVGVHPHNAKDWTNTDADCLRALVASSKKVKAIGEIGLDYHYDFSERSDQQSVFSEQLQLANELQLPAVIHCREAVDDVKKILQELGTKNVVLHCCTEKWEDVEELVKEGCMLSFTGMATFLKATVIHNTIKQCPLSQMMIETDSPYLAPGAHRGKRNEPAFVSEVAKAIAELKGVSLQEVADATTKNAVQFFRLPS